jgi:hypothetical protein
MRLGFASSVHACFRDDEDALLGSKRDGGRELEGDLAGL